MVKKSFLQNLDVDSKELKTKRISSFVADAEAHSQSIIAQKEMQLRELQNQLDKVMDLGDDTTLSIANRVSKANPMQTMATIHDLSIKIKTVEDDLKIMKETHESLFPKKEA